MEEKREQAKKQEEKAQEYWRDYFNMTKSQAEEHQKKEANRIKHEYAKLMKSRGLIMDEGTNGND